MSTGTLGAGVEHSVPGRKVDAVVASGRLVDVFDALCLLRGCRPHQLVHDIVLDHLREAENDPDVRQAVRARRLRRTGLRVIS